MSSKPGVVMRYVKSSLGYDGPTIMTQDAAQKHIVTRRAALPVEWGVRGDELMRLLREGAQKFIRAMELQGLTLIPLSQGNPQVVTNEQGVPIPTYSMTYDLMKSAPDELIDAKAGHRDAGPSTLKVPMSFEDSRGMVDYQIVGVFLAPLVTVEIAKRREDLLRGEREAKNPTVFAYGRTTARRP